MSINLPQFTSLHTARSFLEQNDFFSPDNRSIVLRLNPKWSYVEPFCLAMLAAWGEWCVRNGIKIQVENLGRTAAYAWRMHLFEHLGVIYQPERVEREEASRFLPITKVRSGQDIRNVIANISALLHLQDN